jgi:type I restriction enzyme S subunit
MKEDWIECELGDLLKLKNGFAFQATNYKKEGIPVFRIGDINDWIVSAKNSVKIEEKEVYDEYIVEAGDILIAMSGATTGKFGIYHSTEKAYQNQRVGNLKLYSENSINKSFVFYLLYSLKRDIERDAYGGAQPNISGIKIEALKTKLAPLPIQRAIVSKIEALFSDLDNGIANFKKAQDQLKIYRQAVLKKAFEGELTKVLFNDWEYSTLKESVKFSQGIQVDVNLQSENKSNNSVRFLRIIDFTQGIDPARYIENPGEKYIVRKDDVSLVRYGASTGFVCSNLEGAIANNLFRIIPVKPIDKKYLYYFLCSPLFQNIISQSVKGAAMPAISFGLINDVVLPFPKNISDQAQIVQEIESRLSVCDKMEQSISESIEKAEALRQSILKKAFEGKLLSQSEIELCKKEADYEPASELLKKIQAEKLAKELEKKKPITKKKSKK